MVNANAVSESTERGCKMKSFLVCVFFVSFLVLTQSEEVHYEIEAESKPCTYFYSARQAKPEGGLVNCSWYSDQACCKRTEVTSVFSSIEPLHSATRSCRNQLNYLMCFFCSPNQHLWFIRQKLRVCAEYCDSLYLECLTAGVGERTLGREYANGTAFCEAQNFEVVEGSSCFEYDPDVFGAAHRMTVNFLFLTCLLLWVLVVWRR